MADNDQNPQGGGGTPPAGNAPAGGQSGNDGKGGTPPAGGQQTPPPAGDQNKPAFDPKLLENDEAWKTILGHPRFANLKAKADKADELTAAQAKAEEDRLKEAGEWQKVATTKDSELTEARETIKTMKVNGAIQAAAVKAGITDLEAATLLVNKSDIKVDKDGNISGVDEAVKALTETRPYLLQNNNNPPRLGGGGNPPNNGQGAPLAFTGSQIKDPVFYREHAKEIDKAMQSGTIDMSR